MKKRPRSIVIISGDIAIFVEDSPKTSGEAALGSKQNGGLNFIFFVYLHNHIRSLNHYGSNPRERNFDHYSPPRYCHYLKARKSAKNIDDNPILSAKVGIIDKRIEI